MNIGLPELFIIFALFLLLFGTKRLPEAARSVGKAIREFKKELKNIDGEDTEKD